MKIFVRILAPLTLLEWGGILTYFYFSGRISAFLHPMFRPLVLVTGILLLLTAFCVAIFREEECTHHHDHSEEHIHSHDRLSFGGFLAFLILFFPLALAAKISPDSYGANLVRNRGLVEDVRSIPSAASSFASRSKAIESAASEQPASLTITADATPSPSPKYIGAPEGTSAPNSDSESQPPSTDQEQASPVPDQPWVNDALKPNAAGCIKAEVIDLLYAAQEANTRKDFEGKKVELVGQLVPNKKTKAAAAPADSFKLFRLVIVCCAADAMPVAVKVDMKLSPMEIHEMQWLKVTGRVHYQPRAKGVSDDGIDYGDYPEPVIVADSIKKVEPPKEKYLY